MYLVKRGPSPTSLQQAKARHAGRLPDGDFDVWTELEAEAKRDIKEALLKQQRSVCCYCTCTISYETMKVEHWAPQKGFESKRLDWDNLLAACDGGERSSGELHCDSSKGSSSITLDPSRQEHIQKLKYSMSGRISSDDQDIENDLSRTLSLNIGGLVRARLARWNEFAKAANLKKERLKNRAYRQKLYERVRQLVEDDPAKPYYDMLLYHLGRKHGS